MDSKSVLIAFLLRAAPMLVSGSGDNGGHRPGNSPGPNLGPPWCHCLHSKWEEGRPSRNGSNVILKMYVDFFITV